MLVRPDIGLWVVADGAGGHASGEVASSMITTSLGALPTQLDAAELLSSIRRIIANTHKKLREEAARRSGNVVVASTFVGLVVRDQYFACLWAGDSRAYLLRDGLLQQITHDHSLVQELLDTGHLSPHEAESHPYANIITRAVGGNEETPELDKVIGKVQPGDRFLLCSDGLSKILDQKEIEILLAAPEGVPPTELLVHAALARNANDNVTAIVIEI